jgi:SAM-dependent methyltransferase
MHPSVALWTQAKVEAHALSGAVLEVGSYDVNGSVRALFAGSEYTGVDMREGPGVDQVAKASALPFDDEAFDVVVSTEMLEHDAAFWLSVPEMARVLKPGGHLLLTARSTGFPIHDFPSDYWRFSPEAIGVLFDLAGLAPVEIVPDSDPQSPGVFGLATKPKRRKKRA